MADFYNQGAYHLAENNVYQPVRTNNFKLVLKVSVLTNLQKRVAAAGTTSGFKYEPIPTSAIENDLTLSITGFKPPHFSQDEITIRKGNSEIYFASAPKFSENTIKLLDLQGTQALDVLNAWQAKQYDIDSDAISSSAEYKIPGYVVEYMPDGTAIRGWAISGCWVKGIDESEYNAEQPDKKTITATLRYDKAIPYDIA